jgi:membrane fusion protein (multidrug efflux system)
VAAVINGLSLGDKVIVEGLQRVRPGQPVAPGPASALIQSSMKAAASDVSAPTDGAAAGGAKPAGKSP